MPTRQELQLLQALPLELKIMKTNQLLIGQTPEKKHR
jgi:hypothetical protein